MEFADWATLTATQLAQLFCVGLQFDLLVGLIALMPQNVFIAAHSNSSIEHPASKWSLYSGLAGTVTVVLLVCLLDVAFFREFKARLNVQQLAISGHTDAAILDRIQSFPIVALMFLTGLVAVAFSVYLRKRAIGRLTLPLSFAHRTVTFFVIVAMLIVLGRITNIEDMHISNDPVVNECSGNGLYTFVHDLWQRCNPG